MQLSAIAQAQRPIGNPVDPIFPGRWSPRSMTGGHIDKSTLLTLFEAARWAPSSGNAQPWRFCYALRATDAWNRFFSLLPPINQAWCKNAGVLAVIVSKRTFDHNGKPSRTHAFDTGAAWMSLALQGSLLNLVVHGMADFDYAAAQVTLELPDEYSVESMFAVGHPAPPDHLPEPLRSREKPSQRKNVDEFTFEGRFPA